MKFLIYPISLIFRLFNVWVISSVRDSIGDTIALTAVIREIRRGNPGVKIIIFTNTPEVFTNNPNITRMCTVGKSSVFVRRVFARLLIYFQGERISFFRLEGSHRNRQEVLAQNDRRLAEHLVVANSKNFKPNVRVLATSPEIYLTANESQFVEQFSRRFGKFVVVVSEGKNIVTRNKDWDLAKLQSVIDSTLNDGFNWVHVGMHGDSPLKGVVDMRGRTGLRDLFCLISACSVTISPEGAINHISAALGKKSIVLDSGYTSRDYYMYPTTVFVTDKAKNWNNCDPCWARDCSFQKACMEHLTPDRVRATILALI